MDRVTMWQPFRQVKGFSETLTATHLSVCVKQAPFDNAGEFIRKNTYIHKVVRADRVKSGSI
jgi:hypothetical protein